MPEKIFVLAVTDFGALLVGVTDRENFEEWKTAKNRLRVDHPRRLVLTNSTANAQVMQFTSPYFGDTPQETVYVNAGTLEVIGSLDDQEENCSENNRLYHEYKRAYQEWRGMRSGLVSPSAADIANVSNITQFTKKK